MKLTKRLFAALAASVALFALAGCGTTTSSNSTSTPKDYTQIIHNARPDEENESMLCSCNSFVLHCPFRPPAAGAFFALWDQM